MMLRTHARAWKSESQQELTKGLLEGKPREVEGAAVVVQHPEVKLLVHAQDLAHLRTSG